MLEAPHVSLPELDRAAMYHMPVAGQNIAMFLRPADYPAVSTVNSDPSASGS
jgi:hypothetical protein